MVNFPLWLDPVPSLQDALNAAAIRRPEIKVLTERILAKEAELLSRDAEKYPTLFVSGGYASEENPYRIPEDNWSGTIGITWDLYTGGRHTGSRFVDLVLVTKGAPGRFHLTHGGSSELLPAAA